MLSFMDKQHTGITHTHKALKTNGWQHFQRDLTKITVDLLTDVNVLMLGQELQPTAVQTGEVSFDGQS